MPKHYEPLLWTAASEGDLDGVNQYLALGASPNYQNPDKNNWPVLFAAISAQSIPVVEVLLAANADVRLKDKQLLNAVQHALLRVGIQTTETLVQLLLDQPYLQISKAQLAAATGNLESLSEEPRSELLEVDLAGNSLAHYAVVNNQVEILQFLHHQGVDCFSKNAAGVTSLFAAIRQGHKKIAFLLISLLAPEWQALSEEKLSNYRSPVQRMLEPILFALECKRFEIFEEIMRTVEHVGGRIWVAQLFFEILRLPKLRNISTFKQMISFVNVQYATQTNNCIPSCIPIEIEKHGCRKRNGVLHMAAQAVWEEGLMFLLSYGVPADLESGVGQTARDIMHYNKYQDADSQPICDAKNRLFEELRTRRHMRRENTWPSLITLLINYINRQPPNTLLYRGSRIKIQRRLDEEIQVHRFFPVFSFVPALPNEPKDTVLPTPKKRITVSLIFNEPSTPLLTKELERKLQYYFSGTFFNQSRTQILKESGSTIAEETAESSASAPVVVRV